MRKNFAYGVSVVALLGVIVVVFGQPPTPTESPTATPTPTTPSVLISTATPTPTPTSVPTPAITPNGSGTVSVSSTLGASPSISPSPSATPIAVLAAGLGESDLGWSEKGAPVFRIDQAVLTALARNPTVLEALEQIRLTKGVIIQIRAEALPQIGPGFNWQWTDPNLGSSGGGIVGAGGGGRGLRSDIFYNVRITGTQLVFNYSTFRAIRGTFFQRDSAYFAFRETVDQVIATVKTQFYQVILNRALITVQEEAVHLLESQLKDQQNRFEAGTVPRDVPLTAAIELGKERRPFLKQARANVLNAIEQVHVALGGFLPNFTSSG